MLRKLSLFIFLISCCLKLSAQEKNVETQNLLWGRYLLNFQFSEKWTPFFEVEERLYVFPIRQHQFLPSIGTNYELDKSFSLTAAMMYFELTLPQDQDAGLKELQQELRPQIAVNYKHAISQKLSFLSRLKLEWRYKRRPDEVDYNFANNRLRMRMGLSYKINKKLTTKLLEEIHINIGNNIVRNVFNQNRLSASINYKLNEKLQFEAGYLYWFQQTSSGVDFFSRNIVYFTIKQNLNFN